MGSASGVRSNWLNIPALAEGHTLAFVSRMPSLTIVHARSNVGRDVSLIGP